MAAASRFIDSTATVSDNRNSLQSWRSLTTSATLKARRRFVALRLSRLSARLGRPMLQGRPALSLERYSKGVPCAFARIGVCYGHLTMAALCSESCE